MTADLRSVQNVYLGRQPIFDKNLNVYGYELLFRDGTEKDNETSNKESNNNQNYNSDNKTTSLILNAFSDVGLQSLIGNKLGFINFTENLILNPPPVPTSKIVIEVLEEVKPTPEILLALKYLKTKGFKVALDDFNYKESLDPFLELADIIKIDYLNIDKNKLAENLELFKTHNVKLVAEKIENHDDFVKCKDLGFDYFQGFFLSKPQIVKSNKINTSRLVGLKLLSKLNQPNLNMKELEDMLCHDPKMGYKLIKIVNSAAYHTVQKIDSVKQALVYLGVKNLSEWVTLIVLSGVDNESDETMYSTMVRAKMCELIATKNNKLNPNSYFTVGMFSNLDVMFGRDMRSLIEEVSMTDEIKDALIEHKGDMGEVLKNVLAYERCDWDYLVENGVGAFEYSDIYLKSLEWSNAITGALNG